MDSPSPPDPDAPGSRCRAWVESSAVGLSRPDPNMEPGLGLRGLVSHAQPQLRLQSRHHSQRDRRYRDPRQAVLSLARLCANALHEQMEPRASSLEPRASSVFPTLELRDRAHLRAVCARAMRRILVDHARKRNTDKRQGDRVRVTLREGTGPSNWYRAVSTTGSSRSGICPAAKRSRRWQDTEARSTPSHSAPLDRESPPSDAIVSYVSVTPRRSSDSRCVVLQRFALSSSKPRMISSAFAS